MYTLPDFPIELVKQSTLMYYNDLIDKYTNAELLLFSN